MKNNKIHPIKSPPVAQSSGSNSGNSNDINARISVIEAELKHLATKEDVQKINTSIEEVKTLIGNKESKILRWLMGIISAAVISLIVALVKTFQS
ncbi:MAG: hypothetical protein OXD01_08260 [Gammaproteobacteria bacterium]|nr:hypothetical protein [Gammaproteobacteria bacterium]